MDRPMSEQEATMSSQRQEQRTTQSAEDRQKRGGKKPSTVNDQETGRSGESDQRMPEGDEEDEYTAGDRPPTERTR